MDIFMILLWTDHVVFTKWMSSWGKNKIDLITYSERKL